MKMELGDLYLRELDRGLTLLDTQQRTLDRLLLIRTVMLVFAVLFFRSYLLDLREIDTLRQGVTLNPEEQNFTVVGYLSAHQRIENSTYVPDAKAKALLQLIPRAGAFLGQDLTLENQSRNLVNDILTLAAKKPQRISIDNPYLKLSVPVSYSVMVFAFFLSVLVSFFYESYRNFRLRILMSYVELNRRRLDDLAAPHQKKSSDLPVALPRLFVRNFAVRGGVHTKVPWRKALGKATNWVTAPSGTSLYRCLNALVTLTLFIWLDWITTEILMAERGLSVGFFAKAASATLILVIPSTVLYVLDRYFRFQFRRYALSDLPNADEF
jgi:hypothetical protein